jgi:hypothetical protein
MRILLIIELDGSHLSAVLDLEHFTDIQSLSVANVLLRAVGIPLACYLVQVRGDSQPCWPNGG